MHENTLNYLVARTQLRRSRFATGPGAAWTYLYDVFLVTGESKVMLLKGADRLAVAERYARRNAKDRGVTCVVVRDWEPGKSRVTPAKTNRGGPSQRER